MRNLFFAAVLSAACSSALAQIALPERLKVAQADPSVLKAAVDAGKKAAFFCANCHGDDGVSKTSDVPNLAGQNPEYLLEQIRKFASGERKDPFMQGLIKVFKDEDRLHIALYYANMSVRPTVADVAQATKGKALFTKLCVRCHGEQAHGTEVYPRLAGQKLPYLQTAITRYRDHTGIRSNQLMTIATATLKSDDVIAVANYLAQLP